MHGTSREARWRGRPRVAIWDKVKEYTGSALQQLSLAARNREMCCNNTVWFIDGYGTRRGHRDAGIHGHNKATVLPNHCCIFSNGHCSGKLSLLAWVWTKRARSPVRLCCIYDRPISYKMHISLPLEGHCEDSNGQPALVVVHFANHNPAQKQINDDYNKTNKSEKNTPRTRLSEKLELL